jgi:hypothetical protein
VEIVAIQGDNERVMWRGDIARITDTEVSRIIDAAIGAQTPRFIVRDRAFIARMLRKRLGVPLTGGTNAVWLEVRP